MDLPDNVIEDVDATVTNYWKEGEDSALQLSSIYRSGSGQISASQRLAERLQRSKIESSREFQLETVAPDQAAITYEHRNGYIWLYAYLVWPDLSIFATVFIPIGTGNIRDSWQYQSIKTIRRTYN